MEQPSSLLLFLVSFTILLCIFGLLKLPTLIENWRSRPKSASAHPTPTTRRVEREPTEAERRISRARSIETYRKVLEYRRQKEENELAGQQAQPVTPVQSTVAADTQPQAARIEEISFAALAQGRNILIVGPKGSGKTTLLTRLMAQRESYVEAFDPHNEPGKWPCPVVGGGERFEEIMRHLTAVYELMKVRYKESDAGRRSQVSYQQSDWSLTLVGDEWGGIVSELPSKGKSQLGAGSILGKLLARGRKVGIDLLLAAHDDTAEQLGLGGAMGLVGCFDAIIYLGAQATSNTSIPKEVREAARNQARPAVVLMTERYQWLVMSDSSNHQVQPEKPQKAAPSDYLDQLQRPETQLSRDDDQLQQLLSEFQPLQSETEPLSSVAETAVSPAETVAITLQLQQGATVATIAKGLPGYNGRNYQAYRAKVESVKVLYEQHSARTETLA